MRYVAKSSHILGETRAAITDAGAQESLADPLIHAHATGYVLYIRIHRFAQVGDHVDKGDLHGQESIGGMLDNLRRLGGGLQKRRKIGGGSMAGTASERS